ncbi:MAG: glycosyltransferase family 2 protein [Gammaproteobacteria bacterium]
MPSTTIFKRAAEFRPCALVPVYNHYLELPGLVAAFTALDLPVLLVDDGSVPPARTALDALAESNSDRIELLRFERNRGKGAALLAGFARAAENGYTHAVQIDADGQHDPLDARALLALAREHPQALVSGTPAYDDSVPRVRYYGRWITHLLIWFATLSRDITDSMCGFRIYPLAPTLALARRRKIGTRMDFDTDIMVRLYLAGTPVLFAPVRVSYPPGGLSNYRMLRDNLRMAGLHLRLLGGLPGLAVRRLLSCARVGRSGKHASPP